MEAKAYALISIALIVGAIGGYLAGSMAFQNQIIGLQLQIAEKDQQIAELQETIADLQSSQQAQVTQVRVDIVKWDVANDKVNVTIRNTGGVIATIQSISVRKNVAESTLYTDTTATGTIPVGSTLTIIGTESGSSAPNGFLTYSTSYIIRVTCSTGFYYEMVSTTPASP